VQAEGTLPFALPEVNPRDQGETDAILRRLLMYAKVYADPPVQEISMAETRHRMGELIREGLLDLDGRLRAGEPIPEVWDTRLGYKFRARHRAASYAYVCPPGRDLHDACHACDWIDPGAVESACRRCHTIRKRVNVKVEVETSESGPLATSGSRSTRGRER
jgi:hypothetical protein